MENKLEQLFKVAAQPQPLMQLQEVEALLKSGSKHQVFRTGRGTITLWLSVALLLVVTSVGFLYRTNIDQARDESPRQQEGSSATTREIPRPSPESTVSAQRSEELSQATNANSTKASLHPAKEIRAGAKSFPAISATTTVGQELFRVAEENPAVLSQFDLTFDDLAALGIQTNGSTLLYENVTDSMLADQLNRQDSVFDGRFLYTFKLDIGKSGSMMSTHAFTMIEDVERKGLGKEYHLRQNWELIRRSKLFYPAFIEVFSKDKETPLVMDSYIRKDSVARYLELAKPYLIPITVSLQAVPSAYSTDREVVFWFKPEPAFFAALPAITAQKYLAETPGYLEKYKAIRAAFTKAPEQIQSRGALKLSQEDNLRIRAKLIRPGKKVLMQMNIKPTGKQLYNNRYQINGDVKELKLITRKGYFTVNKSSFNKLKLRKRDKPFYPVALSSEDLQSVQYLYFHQKGVGYVQGPESDQAMFLASIHNLVPVVVESGTNAPRVLWFIPHPDLLELLKTE